ncbi:MAG TPA: flagellar hook-basal body protein [Bacillota bacterium]|nr:flagellar hook-basal body protein [Bacillota bacterium]
MSRPMIQAAVTMNQLQQKMDLIGNNLANSQTTGYKSRLAHFSSLLFQHIDNMQETEVNAEGRLTPDGIRVGTGARLAPTMLDLTPGAINETDRSLDTALLTENHLFQIAVTENGITETRYTRDGAFYISPLGDGESVLLTTKDGYPVLGENGPIEFANDFEDITVQPDGQITITRDGVTETIDNLAIVEATRPNILEAVGENIFRLPDIDVLGYDVNDIIQPVALNGEVVKSGALEQSNVDLAEQMTDLLTAQRSYQFNARTISMSDQMSSLINQLR